MVMKGGQQTSRFAPGCSQPSRDLHKTQSHRETAGSLGTGEIRLMVFRGLAQLQVSVMEAG